jgi:hypothetical protein
MQFRTHGRRRATRAAGGAAAAGAGGGVVVSAAAPLQAQGFGLNEIGSLRDRTRFSP